MDSLIALQFTPLEAAAYVYLLERGPATGYQIAKAIEKPNSNTYQALESLALRGFLLVGDGSPRRYRAVPYEEMLRKLEASYRTRLNAASRELDEIQPATEDHQIYRLSDPGQVIERCRSMLRDARGKVLVDVFPGVFSLISEELTETAKRGVKVIVKVYEPVDVEGVVTIHAYRDLIPQKWGIQWLNVVADGRELLFACLDADCEQVVQAIWSKSPWLVLLVHYGIHSEMLLDDIFRLVKNTSMEGPITDLIKRTDYGGEDDLPGRQDVMRRLAPDHEDDQ